MDDSSERPGADRRDGGSEAELSAEGARGGLRGGEATDRGLEGGEAPDRGLENGEVAGDELDGTGETGDAAPGVRPWYRRLAFLAPVGFLAGMFGLFFVGFVVLLLFFTDRGRDRDVRLGGSVLLLWWLWTWTLPGTAPVVGVCLLLIAAVFLARAARGLAGRGALVAGGLAGLAVVLAGVALFPDGLRGPKFGEDEALRRTLTTRRGAAGNVDAAQADVVLTRARFTNRPYYFVVLHEQNPERRTTGDGEPCFRRAEVHLVDALDGTVERRDVTEARAEDGHCLPLRVGTGAGLVPVED